MAEYAVLSKSGSVIVISGWTGPFDQEYKDRLLEQISGAVDVVPISQVPSAVLERYQYWNERP